MNKMKVGAIMSNIHEINDKEFERELNKCINKMTSQELSKFLTIISARNIIYLIDDFFKHEKAFGYLNGLFISLSYNCAVFFNASDRVIALNNARTIDSAIARTRSTTFDSARIIANESPLARAIALDRALDLAVGFESILALTRDHTLVRDRAIDITIALNRAIDRAINHTIKFKKITLCDAQKNLQHETYIYNIYSDDYRCDFEKFLNNLHECKASYWAEWFEDLFKNNLKLTKTQIEDLLFLEEKHFELSITETSALLFERRKGTKFFNETRLILLGDKGSGKTSFARRFQNLNAKMPDKKESTPGVDFHPIKTSTINPKYTGEQDFTINIWDFAGHTVTHAAHKFFLSDRATYVIVYHGRTEKNNTSINEWLEHITYYAESSAKYRIKIYILVNKSDDNIPKIEYDLKYNKDFDIQKYIINLEKDNQINGALDNFRNQIMEHIIASPQNKDIPASIFDIKNEIQEILKEGTAYTHKTKIEKIIKNILPEYQTNYILGILHSYGICLYYDKLKDDDDNIVQVDAIVLNPRWVTYAIYKIINFITNDINRDDGHISESEYKKAFSYVGKDDEAYKQEHLDYSTDMYPYISALAEAFDLAYKVKKDNLLIFPICLPENYPYSENGLGEPAKNDFFVEITTSTERSNLSPVTFPKDIIPAFIVKRHKDLDHIPIDAVNEKAYCSRNGAVLKRSGIKAEVRKKENSKITVLVKKNDQKSCDFGMELVSDLYSVIQKYKVFQNQETRPLIKIWYTDSKERDKNYEIAEILEANFLAEEINEPNIQDYFTGIISTLKNNFRKKFTFKTKGNIGPAELELEIELDEKEGKKEN